MRWRMWWRGSRGGTVSRENKKKVQIMDANISTGLDKEYGFVESKKLAERDSAAAIINPDSYRVFAEMSMSPETKWNAPAG